MFGLPTAATDAAPQGALGLGANYFSANGNQRNVAMIFPQAAFRALSQRRRSEAAKLQIGRFLFQDGSELAPKDATLSTVKRDHVSARLLGDFGFSDVGRSFDGVHYSYSTASNDFTFIAATPTRGVYQVDGWGWNRIGFGYASYTHDSARGRHAADTRFFVLTYDDWRHILKTDNRPAAVRKGDTENILIETFGAHTLHTFATNPGVVDLLAWGAVQTGRWGDLQQRAYALDFEAGFQPAISPALKPWLRAGFTEGSGDGNPNDKTHGTFFQVLPTPRIYARFPFFNMMNTQDGFGALILRPHPKVTVSSEFHSLRLSNANDLWYSGGGAYDPGASVIPAARPPAAARSAISTTPASNIAHPVKPPSPLISATRRAWPSWKRFILTAKTLNWLSRVPLSFLIKEMSFAGLRVLSLESRRAQEIEGMIRRLGGDAFVAPSVQERALEDHADAIRFVENLEAGEFDLVVCMTGAGLSFLREVVAVHMPVDRLAAALRRVTIVCRGPKPVPLLREMNVPVHVVVPEPNTWKEIVDAVAGRSERRIALQEYGRPNPEMNRALENLGARVTPVAIYRWELPSDIEPLREAARRLAARAFDVVLFTSSVQLDHLYEVSRALGLEEQVADTLRWDAAIASVGPIMTAALEAYGLPADIIPNHPKMGSLVKAAAESAATVLASKRIREKP